MSGNKTVDTSVLQLRFELAEKKGRNRSLVSTGALVLALLVAATPYASPQGVGLRSKPTLDSLQAQVNTLQAQVNSLLSQQTATTAALSAETATRAAADTAETAARAGADTVLTTSVASLNSSVSTLSTSVASLQTSTATLTAKTQFMSVSGTDTIFTATNVVVINGQGNTATDNGLGNLIVGYNEGFSNPDRTGSHNLVLGAENSYTSHGGAVFGAFNTISGTYASILGGANNIASGDRATVTGGFRNNASGSFSNISGGGDNNATGQASAVGGGSTVTETDDFGWAAGTLHTP